LYSDGGCCKKNPSPYGISWAFVATDENDEEIYRESGHITTANCKGYKASNNLAEMIAAVKALEYARGNLAGNTLREITLYCDSELTLHTLFLGYSMKRLPRNVIQRMNGVLTAIRIGRAKHINWILVAGHPTKKDLEQGFKVKNKQKLPVSKYNVECDKMCRIEAAKLVPMSLVV
jgi:Ribonuclease HI